MVRGLVIDLRSQLPNKKFQGIQKTAAEASRSKWEGVQVTAARTLSEWGDKNSLEIVKFMLIEKATMKGRYSATNTIAELLSVNKPSTNAFNLIPQTRAFFAPQVNLALGISITYHHFSIKEVLSFKKDAVI